MCFRPSIIWCQLFVFAAIHILIICPLVFSLRALPPKSPALQCARVTWGSCSQVYAPHTGTLMSSHWPAIRSRWAVTKRSTWLERDRPRPPATPLTWPRSYTYNLMNICSVINESEQLCIYIYIYIYIYLIYISDIYTYMRDGVTISTALFRCHLIWWPGTVDDERIENTSWPLKPSNAFFKLSESRKHCMPDLKVHVGN